MCCWERGKVLERITVTGAAVQDGRLLRSDLGSPFSSPVPGLALIHVSSARCPADAQAARASEPERFFFQHCRKFEGLGLRIKVSPQMEQPLLPGAHSCRFGICTCMLLVYGGQNGWSHSKSYFDRDQGSCSVAMLLPKPSCHRYTITAIAGSFWQGVHIRDKDRAASNVVQEP